MAEDSTGKGEGLSSEEKARLEGVKETAFSREFIVDKTPIPASVLPPTLPERPNGEHTPDIVVSIRKGTTTRSAFLGGLVGSVIGGIAGFIGGRNSSGNPDAAITTPKLPDPFAAVGSATPTVFPSVTPISREMGFNPFRDLQVIKEVRKDKAILSLERAREVPFNLDTDPDSELMKQLTKEMPNNKISAVHIGLLPRLNVGSDETYQSLSLKDLKLSDSTSIRVSENEEVYIDFINRRTADDYLIYAMIYSKKEDKLSQTLNLKDYTPEQTDRINRGLSTGVVKQLYSQIYPRGVTDVYKTELAQRVGGDLTVPPSLKLV